MNDSIETDVVVVGSGPGGAGVVRDLTLAGNRKVTVVKYLLRAPPTSVVIGISLKRPVKILLTAGFTPEMSV